MWVGFSDFSSLVIVMLIFAWLGTLTFLLVRVLRTFSKLTKGVSEKDLKNILEEILEAVEKDEKLGLALKKELEELKEEGLGHIQKVGLVRYNPFAETGGNQSFVLAVLDGKDSGFVVTSLHSRESTRVFAKPVKEGKESGFEFSKEEIQAVLEARKKGIARK